MATLNSALAIIEHHLGFPTSRSRTVARRLQEASLLPLGAPGVAPEIDVDGFLSLVVALGANTTLHGAPAAVRDYWLLTPSGTDVTGAPSIVQTAGEALIRWTDTALHGNAGAISGDKIEFVSSFPEIVIHEAGGTVRRFQPGGTLPNHWQAAFHRKAITINGAAIVAALHELFGGKN